MPHPIHRMTLAAAAVALLALGAASCSSSDDRSASTTSTTSAGATTTTEAPEGSLTPGSRHELIDEDGHFAYAAPRLAEKVALQPDGDGVRAHVRIAYDVANSRTAKGVVADRAEVTLRVARSMMSMGPQPDDPVFTTTVEDPALDRADAARDYDFELPAEARTFLEGKGVSFDGDAATGDALELVDVSVQQHRDLQLVDGRADWIHGATFVATQSPTTPSDKPGGALTVKNDTGSGIFTYPSSELEPVPQLYGPNLYPNPDEWETASETSTGVTIALSGQSGSCFYQGTDNSNPNGFNVSLAPGDTVTQTIVANDQDDNLPFNNTEAASMADATEVVLKTAVTTFDTALSLVFGGPFTLPIALATDVISVSQYCNNQPNLMQLGAVVADTGEGANSTMWAVWDGCGGTCGGFANVYTSPWESDAPNVDAELATQAVQLAPDSNYTYEGSPLWLAQTPMQGCGIGDANDSNTSGCTSQNLISLRWSQEMPCPYNNGIEPAQGNVIGNGSLCYQPAPTSPEVEACGPSNAQCPSYDPDE
jgi:hypothetical protein